MNKAPFYESGSKINILLASGSKYSDVAVYRCYEIGIEIIFEGNTFFVAYSSVFTIMRA